MIYALLSKIVASRIYAILWAKSLRMPGLGGGGGGQPNLGNACILGASGPVTPPLVGLIQAILAKKSASPKKITPRTLQKLFWLLAFGPPEIAIRGPWGG